MMYIQDYDERYPQSFAEGGGPAVRYFVQTLKTPSAPTSLNWLTWGAVIQPYIKNTQVMGCPSINAYDWSGNPSAAFATQVPVGYSYNNLLSWNSQAKIAAPASIFLVHEFGGDEGFLSILLGNYPHVTDASWGPNNPYSFGMGVAIYSGFVGLPDWNFDRIHSGTNNYLYADGHVKALKPVGNWRTNPYASLSADGQLTGYWNCGGGAPCLWIPEFE